ncbi:MAG: helix-turn-helix transcriptional regulator [Pelobium sp.]
MAQLRIAKGLTQQQLASILNKDFQSISRLENGRVNACAYSIQQIAKALKVPIKDLFDFS